MADAKSQLQTINSFPFLLIEFETEAERERKNQHGRRALNLYLDAVTPFQKLSLPKNLSLSLNIIAIDVADDDRFRNIFGRQKFKRPFSIFWSFQYS